jgi:hypothetical protein
MTPRSLDLGAHDPPTKIIGRKQDTYVHVLCPKCRLGAFYDQTVVVDNGFLALGDPRQTVFVSGRNVDIANISTTDMLLTTFSAEHIFPEYELARSWYVPSESSITVTNMSQSWVDKARKEIDSYRDLPAGWDDYDSPSVNPGALSVALQVLDDPGMRDFPRPMISPSSDGGVVFEWRKGENDLTIEFLDLTDVQVSYNFSGVASWSGPLTEMPAEQSFVFSQLLPDTASI